jgi:hypothetical protein
MQIEKTGNFSIENKTEVNYLSEFSLENLKLLVEIGKDKVMKLIEDYNLIENQ